MSDAACPPEQLDLDLDLDPTGSELFRRFRQRIIELVRDHGISEAVCSELRNWGQFHDFPLVASWVRKLLRDPYYVRGVGQACVLLECFGTAFRGDTVGHIGRDVITGPLNSENRSLRESAINVLGRWLEYDEDGLWLSLAEDHLDRERERDGQLYEKLWSFVSWFHDEESDVQEHPDPDYENWLEVRGECECEMRGTFPILKLGPVVSRLTGLDAQSLSAVVELAQMPVEWDMTLPTSTSHLGVSMHTTAGGRIVRVFDPQGSFAFSVEPTATKGRFLLFCYLA